MVITGAVLGALARLIIRGEQNISILWTIILGTVGALIGGTIASFFGVADTSGIDWIRWTLSLIAAIGTTSACLKLAGRKRTTLTDVPPNSNAASLVVYAA